jgi:hypothetical protein
MIIVMAGSSLDAGGRGGGDQRCPGQGISQFGCQVIFKNKCLIIVDFIAKRQGMGKICRQRAQGPRE